MRIDQRGITLVVAWPRGKGYEFARVKTAEKFTEKLRSVVDSAESRLAKSEGRPYAIGDDIEDDEYMTCALARIPRDAPKSGESKEGQKSASKRRTASITTEDPQMFRDHLVAFGAMDPIGAKALREKQTISFYAILKGDTTYDRIAYVRRLNPMRLAKPGNLLAGLKDALTVLETDIFAMDDRVDLIVRPTTVDVVNKTFFDALFFGLSGEGADIDAIVAEMLLPLPILPSTLNLLIERSRLRKRVRRKMLEIKQSGHLASVTMDDFRHALDEAGLPYDQFVAVKDGKESIFAADSDTDLLFYILNDDLFKGALTGKSFAVSKKHLRRSGGAP